MYTTADKKQLIFAPDRSHFAKKEKLRIQQFSTTNSIPPSDSVQQSLLVRCSILDEKLIDISQ